MLDYSIINRKPTLTLPDKDQYLDLLATSYMPENAELSTKKKDEALEEKLETALLKNDYIFSLTSEYKNSDGSIYRVYEIRLEDFKYAK